METIIRFFGNPIVTVLFSGVGVTVICGIINGVQNRKNNLIRKWSKKNDKKLNADIEEIKRLISCATLNKLRQEYIRLFNKYKSRLTAEDTQSLKQQEASRGNYADLMSALLGLLEAL